MVVSYCIGQRRNAVPYPVATIAGYFALALALFAATWMLKPLPVGWRLAGGTLLLALYAGVTAYAERNLIARILQRLKSR